MPDVRSAMPDVRRTGRWLAAVAVLLLIAPVSLAQSDAEHQQFLFAYKLLQRGDVDEAAAEFDEYLGRFPTGEKIGDAQYYRALLYRRAGDNERAAGMLAGAAAPTLVPAYAVDLLSGQVLSDLGRYDRALASLEKIKTDELEPRIAVSALYLKGLAYRGAENLDAAAAALGEAADLDTPMKPRALLDLAKVRALMGSTDEALATLERCLAENDPAVTPEAARFAGDLSYNAGKYRPAIGYYGRVLARHQTSPHFAPSVVGTLWALFAEGRYDDLQRSFDQYIDQLSVQDKLPAYYLAGSASQEKGDHARAVELLTQVSRGDGSLPIQEKVLYKLAVSQFHLGQRDAMNATIGRLLELFPQSPLRVDVAFLQATADAEAGEVARGAARLTRFIDRGPSSPYYQQALLRRAHLYETHAEVAAAAGDYDAYLRSVAQPSPISMQAGFRLMELLNALGQHDRVIALASSVLEMDNPELRTPEAEQEALYRLAVAQRFSGQYDRALTSHDRLIREHPLNPYRAESMLEQGLIHMKLGDAQRGVPLLLDAAQREGLGNSSRLSALRIVAQHDADTGNADRALQLRLKMQAVAGFDVLSDDEQLWVGHALIARGEPGEALKHLDAVTAEPLRERRLLMTGRALRLTGQHEKAIETLDEVRAISERYGVEAWLEIALTLRDQGQLDRALAELAPLQDPDRGHSIASRALYEAGLIHQRLLADAARRGDRPAIDSHTRAARESFKKLWLLYPDRVGETLAKRAYLALAELQHQAGEQAEEVATLEELAGSAPDSAYASYAKAVLAIRAGRTERADAYLRQTLDQAAGDDDLRHRAERLLRRER